MGNEVVQVLETLKLVIASGTAGLLAYLIVYGMPKERDKDRDERSKDRASYEQGMRYEREQCKEQTDRIVKAMETQNAALEATLGAQRAILDKVDANTRLLLDRMDAIQRGERPRPKP